MHAISPRVLIVLGLLVCAFMPGRADAASVPLDWASPPTPVENLRPYGPWYQVRAASCPTPAFCVAVDGEGSAFVSTDPGGGPEAWALHALPIRAREVACPSPALCVAAGDDSIATSTDPLNGVWTTTPLGDRGPEGIECPSPFLCVAFERTYGRVWTTDEPTGPASAWTLRTVPIQLRDLSCPDEELCVGAGGNNEIVTATIPAGPSRAWSVTRIEGLNQPFSVSCGSPTQCAVMSSQGGALATAADPTGGTGAWTVSRFAHSASSVFCATATLCFADGSLVSTAPAGGATTFTDSPRQAHVLACAGADFCLGSDGTIRGAVLTSSTPAQGAWARAELTQHGVRALSGVACPSPTRCLVATEDGRIVTSAAPSGPRSGWAPEADLRPRGADTLTALGCGPSRCVAGDVSGGLFERDPAGTWRRTAGGTGAAVLGAACAGDALCAVSDAAGDVRRSTGTGWRTQSVARTALNGIACPSDELCVAVGEDGRAYHSSGGGWRSQRVSFDGALLSVACPTTRLCVAGSHDGVFTTVAPASDVHWSERELYDGAMTGVACPSVSLCVAVSDAGSIFASAEPSTGELWEESHAYGPMTAVACAGDAVCLAVDEQGYAFVGTGRGLPYATSAPRIEPAARQGDTLHCDPGSWTGSPTLTYEWEWRGRLIEQATGATFALRADDEGHAFSCRVTAVNHRGKAVATSGATIVFTPPLAVGELTFFGAAEAFNLLRCDQRFTGGRALNVTYAWTRDGLRIANWPYSHMVFGPEDVGHTYTCAVTGTNEADSLTVTSPVFTVAPARAASFVLPGPAPFTGRLAIKTTKLATLLKRGLPVTVTCSHRCSVTVRLVPDAATAKRLGLRRGAAFGSAERALAAGGAATVRVKLSAPAQRAIKRKRVRSVRLTVSATEAGKRAVSGGKTLTLRG